MEIRQLTLQSVDAQCRLHLWYYTNEENLWVQVISASIPASVTRLFTIRPEELPQFSASAAAANHGEAFTLTTAGSTLTCKGLDNAATPFSASIAWSPIPGRPSTISCFLAFNGSDTSVLREFVRRRSEELQEESRRRRSGTVDRPSFGL